MWKHNQMRNDLSMDPLTFLVKIGLGLCNIRALQRFRLGAGLMGVYVLGQISSFAPIVGRMGTPVDENSAEIISKFKELSATQEGGSSSSIGDEIYTQVMGEERPGRVCGYGLGPTPTSVFGSMSCKSHAAFEEVVGELSSVQQKLLQMEEWKKNQEEEKCQMEEWKKNQEEEKRQMEEWKKNQEEEKRAHLEQMKLMHAIIAEMRQQLSAKRQDPSEGGADG